MSIKEVATEATEATDMADMTEVEEAGEEISFNELLATLALSGEVIITIPSEQEIRVKTGLKGKKSKSTLKLREMGLPAPEETLEFYSIPSKKYDDCVDLHIVLKRKGVLTVMEMTIPDNTL